MLNSNVFRRAFSVNGPRGRCRQGRMTSLWQRRARAERSERLSAGKFARHEISLLLVLRRCSGDGRAGDSGVTPRRRRGKVKWSRGERRRKRYACLWAVLGEKQSEERGRDRGRKERQRSRERQRKAERQVERQRQRGRDRKIGT